jgi:[acyl-carrier-protein] S-malonyltransferase
MQTMAELGVTGLLEVPPAGTLAGLAKRALPGVEVVALKTPDDLEAARKLVEEHGTASPMDDSPTWRMLVAPVAGTFRRGPATLGDDLVSGVEVGAVVTPPRRTAGARAARRHGARVAGRGRRPVSPGQPLVRLHPEAVST